MGVPEVFTKEIIDVVMPNTKGTVPFKNPLVKYTTSGSIEGKPMGDPSLGKYAIKHSIADKDKQGNPIYYPVSYERDSINLPADRRQSGTNVLAQVGGR